MRNLKVYPITYSEVRNYLFSRLDEYKESGDVGSLDGVILSRLLSNVTLQQVTLGAKSADAYY